MESNTISERAKIKGYLFELSIQEMLKNNGFDVIPIDRQYGVKCDRNSFVEVEGRGTWHQIDCPFVYYAIPGFTYPMRLIGEVKYHSRPIDKSYIREFIGVLSDIEENYIINKIPDNIIKLDKPRYIDMAAFFSATGFNKEAENLAYAHGIKTISYINNPLVGKIKEIIDRLEEKYIDYNEIKGNEFGKWYNCVKREYDRFSKNKSLKIPKNKGKYFVDGYETVLLELIRTVKEYAKNSFIGTSVSGVTLHFIGNESFPDEIFSIKDKAKCKIFYEKTMEGRFVNFYIVFSEDENKRKFYFDPPEYLLDAVKNTSRTDILASKEEIFSKVYVNTTISEMRRNLVLSFDPDWMSRLKEEIS